MNTPLSVPVSLRRTRTRPRWLAVPERGTTIGIWLFVGMLSLAGRRLTHLMLGVVIAYYFVCARSARSASRAFLQRCGYRGTHREIYRHLFTFGRCTLDRVLFVRGHGVLTNADAAPNRHRLCVVVGKDARPVHHALTNRGPGMLLLGAHVGSFEALGAIARDAAVRLTPVINSGNARRLQAVLQALNPAAAARLLDLSSDPVTVILELRRRLSAGEHVALLADRLTPGDRQTIVRFFDTPARLPSGPYLLAAMLKCPVVMVAAVPDAKGCYHVVAQPLTKLVQLPRTKRAESLARYAQSYADWLEDLAKTHPFAWFNFYDFWEHET